MCFGWLHLRDLIVRVTSLAKLCILSAASPTFDSNDTRSLSPSCIFAGFLSAFCHLSNAGNPSTTFKMSVVVMIPTSSVS